MLCDTCFYYSSSREECDCRDFDSAEPIPKCCIDDDSFLYYECDDFSNSSYDYIGGIDK